MQLVQELKFSYDTGLDPEIDKAVEDLVFLIHAKGGMIKDAVTPNRGGSTIVNRPNRSSDGTGSITDWPGKIVKVSIDDYTGEVSSTWACGRNTGDSECDCQFPQNKSWDSIPGCQR